MSTSKTNRWALFGGAGFIGQHLAYSILNRMPQAQVQLLDIQNPTEISWKVPARSIGRFRSFNRATL